MSEAKPATYAEMRAAGKSMCEKVFFMAEPCGFEVQKAARALGIPTPGRAIRIAGEADLAALSDFLFAEFRVQGRTLVEVCDPSAEGFTPGETQHLEAFRHSRTSLFHATHIIPSRHQIVLVH